MRQESQQWNVLRAYVEVISAGAGVTGLSPTVEIQRIADGLWWDGATWAASPTALSMTAHANLAGVYQYAVDPSGLDYDLAFPGYVMRIVEGTTPLREHVYSSTLRRSAWDDIEPISGETFGDQFFRMVALRQENLRVVYDTWTAAGQVSHGFVYIYESKADLEADVAPWPLAVGKYEIDQAYDGSSRPTIYTSTKET